MPSSPSRAVAATSREAFESAAADAAFRHGVQGLARPDVQSVNQPSDQAGISQASPANDNLTVLQDARAMTHAH